MIEDLLKKLRENEALRDGDEVRKAEMPVKEPSYADIPKGLSEQVKTALAQNGISRLFSHQAEAIETALCGDDVILESPTASGKTLSFAAPMLDLLYSDRNARALMIYPMKAVAYDQRRQIKELCQSLNIESWSYDGDTDEEHKRWIRQNPPHILMTNPEYLHSAFLGWHREHWENFLRQLKFVVFDEVHEYRGYFGSNMAILTRRFLLKLSRYGVYPQLFLASATCENAKEHAESLTGRQSVELVSARDKFRPLRHFAFINPKSIPEYNFMDIFRLRIVLSALSCLELQKSVLIFVPNINFGEKTFQEAMAKAGERGLDENQISFFHAGLPVDRKQGIQEKMQQGQLKVLFSTNALELGIDIGKLDGVILAGFPDNTMAAWQRIGRAGRGLDSEAFVLFYALNNPWDKFHAANLSEFVSRKLDEIVLDPDNEVAIKKHLPCLLYEAEYEHKQKDESILGSPLSEELKINLANGGEGHPGHKPPYHTITIRGSMGQKYKLMNGRQEVGSISESRKYREAYLGAVFLHDGIKYRVEGHGQEVVNLGGVKEHFKTDPSFSTNVKQERIFAGNRKSLDSILITAMYAGLTIIENFWGYNLIDGRNGDIIESHPGNNVARTFQQRHAFVLTLENCEGATQLAITALEQLFRIGAMFIIPADRHDTDTCSVAKEKSIYLYENYEGGIGVAKKMLSKWVNVLEAGKEIAQNCPCEKGCPNCIMPPRRSDEINKEEGINLAEEIIELWKNDSAKEGYFDSEMFMWKPR